MLKNDKGYTLVVVILVLVVLSILGAAFMSIALSEISQTASYSDNTQAYYNARSGAEIGWEWLRNQNTLEDLFDTSENKYLYYGGSINNVFNNGFIYENLNVEPDHNNKQISVSVFYDYSNNEVRIESIGNHNGESEKETLVLSLTSDNDVIFDNALFTMQDLDITHNNINIEGSVESKGSIIHDSGFSYPVKEYSERNFGAPIMPNEDDLVHRGSLDVGNGSGELLGGYYENIISSPNGSITINSGNEGDETIILVDHIDSKGDVHIDGEGDVYMFVRNSGNNYEADFKTPHSSTGTFIMFLDDDVTMNLQTPGASFDGYLYGPNSNLRMQAHSIISGAAIVNSMINEKNYEIEFKEHKKLDESRFGRFIEPAPGNIKIASRDRWI